MTATTYRPFHSDEAELFVQNDARAFNVDPEVIRSLMQTFAHCRGLFAGAQLLAQLELLPLRLQTGAGEVRCGGFAAVASPVEARRRGHVAALLRHACDELQSQGVALAMLYPFQQSFYDRYGWATCMERRIMRGSPDLFQHFTRLPGDWVPVGPDAIPELQQIYAGALRGRFGVLLRDEAWWRRKVLHNWENKARSAYVWRDEQGQGRAYMIYEISAGERPARKLTCREVVALDPTARSQIFVFMADHGTQCGEVVFRTPADAPVNLLLRDPLRVEVEPYFMLRLLDVATALSQFPYPVQVEGRLSIALSDDWLDHNQATFELEVSEGRGVCRRLPPGHAADLACNVRTLTAIYTRYLRARTAAAFGLLDVDNRPALNLLDRLFSGLAPFSSDMF